MVDKDNNEIVRVKAL